MSTPNYTIKQSPSMVAAFEAAVAHIADHHPDIKFEIKANVFLFALQSVVARKTTHHVALTKENMDLHAELAQAREDLAEAQADRDREIAITTAAGNRLTEMRRELDAAQARIRLLEAQVTVTQQIIAEAPRAHVVDATPWDGIALRVHRERLGMGTGAFARVLGVHRRSLELMESGAQKTLSPPVREWLAAQDGVTT